VFIYSSPKEKQITQTASVPPRPASLSTADEEHTTRDLQTDVKMTPQREHAKNESKSPH